jgi:hypothetical protein
VGPASRSDFSAVINILHSYHVSNLDLPMLATNHMVHKLNVALKLLTELLSVFLQS